MNNLYTDISKCFSEGDKVVVGVSGGADSMVLLHALQNCGVPLNLHVAHLNHMLRGDESMRDEKFVINYCIKNKLNHSVKRVSVSKLAVKRGMSEELCGRDERYRFFNSIAEKCYIATAHTLSDKVETLLFNLTRGASLTGLCSIPTRRDNIIRPLINVSREKVEKYCKEHDLKYINDSTNFSTKYSRNKIRLKVIPTLKEINSAFEQNAGRMMSSISDDRDYLDMRAQKAYDNCINDDKLELEPLNKLHTAIKSRVVSIYLENNNIEVNYNTIQEALRLTQISDSRYNIIGNMYIISRKGMLWVEEPIQTIPYFEYIVGDCSSFTEGGFEFSIRNIEDYKQLTKIKKNFLYLVVDYDKLIGKVKIRQRLAGDSIHLHKRPSKLLKKLFNELKIPLQRRNSLSVFADSQGVFAVEDVGIDQRVIPNTDTNRFLFIKKLKGSTK